ARDNVELAVRDIQKGSRLSKIFALINRDKDKYVSAHSVLLAHIACSLAAKLEWSSESTFRKLTLAAFFHDMRLTNHTLAAIQSMEELESRRDDFTDLEYQSFRNHPMEAAAIIRTFSEIP